MALATILATESTISDALSTAFNSVTSDFSDYALIAIPIALTIFAIPFGVKLVMKLFKSLARG